MASTSLRRIYRKCGKRWFDLSVAVTCLFLTAPALLLLSLLVRAKLGKPILFTQLRPGLGGRPFSIYKLRTMSDKFDPSGKQLADADRLTPFGQWLRGTSLDELPELFNVIRGEMSLVGPRPLLMKYLDRYTPEQMRRHEVRPGITGWAQVNGRNNLCWEEKFRHDVWYVDHCSFGLDLKILLMTARNILTREGINQVGHATAEEFQGSECKA